MCVLVRESANRWAVVRCAFGANFLYSRIQHYHQRGEVMRPDTIDYRYSSLQLTPSQGSVENIKVMTDGLLLLKILTMLYTKR